MSQNSFLLFNQVNLGSERLGYVKSFISGFCRIRGYDVRVNLNLQCWGPLGSGLTPTYYRLLLPIISRMSLPPGHDTIRKIIRKLGMLTVSSIYLDSGDKIYTLLVSCLQIY